MESNALGSLSSVWASLTPNAKKIYTIILKYQIDRMDTDSKDGYKGSFHSLSYIINHL